MGDGPFMGIARFEYKDVEHVTAWVLETYPNSRLLERKEFRKYEKRLPILGWSIPFGYNGVHFDLHVIVPEGFPWERPSIYCREKYEFRKFPHIEKDGAFCLYPSGTEHNPLDPCGLVRDAIKEATYLIASSFDDKFLDDFTTEFASYWTASDGGRNIVSLLSPNKESRRVSLWRSKGDYYLADNDDTLLRWLQHRFPNVKRDVEFEAATHISLNRPIQPDEYPRSGKDVLRIVRELAPNAQNLLSAATEPAKEKFVIAFEGHSDNGPILFAVDVLSPKKAGMPADRMPDMLQKGFRPGKIPETVRLQRMLGGNSIIRHEVERADASWVHGRDAEGFPPLFSKRVLMVGCGSLGSEVAHILAKSGVGSISLIDPELMEYANVGRHALGVSEVKTWKAKSLASKLRQNYPHMVLIEAFPKPWQEVYGEQPKVFRDVDLVISTVGGWLVEGRLNETAILDRDFAPVLYGWAEPFSVAGHAVLVSHGGSCLACGLDELGLSLHKVCEWDASTTRKEPHCGASFQPYGPIALSGVVSLTAKVAIKALLGEIESGTHSMFWSPQSEIAEVGGRFTEGFLAEFEGLPNTGGTQLRQWEKDNACAFCFEK